MDRLGIAERIFEAIVLPRERYGLVRFEQEPNELHGLFEPIFPLTYRGKCVTKHAVLGIVPGGSDSKLQPPIAHVIYGRCHLREEARVSVRDAGDKDTQANPLRRLRERSKGGPAVEAGALGTVTRLTRDEMVDEPGGGELRLAIEKAPHAHEFRPWSCLGGYDSKLHR